MKDDQRKEEDKRQTRFREGGDGHGKAKDRKSILTKNERKRKDMYGTK